MCDAVKGFCMVISVFDDYADGEYGDLEEGDHGMIDEGLRNLGDDEIGIIVNVFVLLL